MTSGEPRQPVAVEKPAEERYRHSRELLLELENPDRERYDYIYWQDQLLKLEITDFDDETLESMALSRSATYERIVAKAALRAEPSPVLDRLLLKILAHGSGSKEAEWWIATYFQEHVPADPEQQLQLNKFMHKHLRKQGVNRWQSALQMARKGTFENVNQQCLKILNDPRAELAKRTTILANIYGIAPAIAYETTLRYLSDNDQTMRETALRVAIKQNIDVPPALQQSLMADNLPIIQEHARLHFAKEQPAAFPEMDERMQDKFRGAAWGHIVGDTLGQSVECLDREQKVRLVGEVTDFVSWHHQTLENGEYTDDSDMVLMQLEILSRGLPIDEWRLSQMLGQAVTRMDRNQELDRHYSFNTMMAMRRCELGVPEEYTGDRATVTNGAAIRSLPMVREHLHDYPRMAIIINRCTALTHHSDIAMDGAVGVALTVSEMMKSDKIDIDRLFEILTTNMESSRMIEVFETVKRLIESGAEPEEAQEELKTGSFVDQSVPYALYCFLRTPDDFREIMRAAINVEGDSDSIAAIAGSFCGAYLGESGIPKEWKQKLKARARIEELLDKSTRISST